MKGHLNLISAGGIGDRTSVIGQGNTEPCTV